MIIIIICDDIFAASRLCVIARLIVSSRQEGKQPAAIIAKPLGATLPMRGSNDGVIVIGSFPDDHHNDPPPSLLEGKSSTTGCCRSCCCRNCCCCKPGVAPASCIAFFLLPLAVLLAVGADAWFVRVLGGSFGPGFAAAVSPWARNAEWERIEEEHRSRFWMEESVVFVGNQNTDVNGRNTNNKNSSTTTTNGAFSSRGTIVDADKKMPVASASKMVSAAIVYAATEDDAVNLTIRTKPVDVFPSFWVCDDDNDDDDDARCRDEMNLETLLAFRDGFSAHGCTLDNAPGTWEGCAKQIFGDTEYSSDNLGVFSYHAGHILIAGLMALKRNNEVAGRENEKWRDLVDRYVVGPAGIVPAPSWRTDDFVDGSFSYDYTGFDPVTDNDYNPDFPGLSGGLGCSPRQFAAFLVSFVNGEIVSRESVQSVMASRGGTGPPFEMLADMSGYGQGVWVGPDRVHSAGVLGFYPWIENQKNNESSTTTEGGTTMVWGLVAMDNREYWHSIEAIVWGVVFPVLLGLLLWSVWRMTKARR